MRTVRHERLEMRHSLQEQVTNVLDDGLLFLALRQALSQDLVDREHFVNVPEYLADKVIAAVGRNDFLRPQRLDP